VDKFFISELNEGLRTAVLGRHAVLLDTVDSTNNEVRRRLETSSPEGLVVIALEQTDGRGRHGKTWISPKGCGLWMTFAFRAFLPPEAMQRATLAAGVAVCRAVEELAGGAVEPLIKWPNDVLVDGKKLCGILSESVPSPLPLSHLAGGESLPNIIVGVGVNTCKPPGGWGGAEGVAVSLEEAAGMMIPRMRLAASILNRMEELLDAMRAQGFTPVAAEYRKRMLPAGTKVVLSDGSNGRRGRVEGLDDEGALLVRLDSGETERLISGEITLRGVVGYV
jgi:BirA family biotin operon repressor/biotin-[acetyl-CoA-carboxylase] ligase